MNKSRRKLRNNNKIWRICGIKKANIIINGHIWKHIQRSKSYETLLGILNDPEVKLTGKVCLFMSFYLPRRSLHSWPTFWNNFLAQYNVSARAFKSFFVNSFNRMGHLSWKLRIYSASLPPRFIRSCSHSIFRRTILTWKISTPREWNSRRANTLMRTPESVILKCSRSAYYCRRHCVHPL